VSLKPCPFCGEPPKTMARPNNADSTQFFACVVCYCDGYSATAHKSASRPTQQEAEAAARAAWNTRAAQAPATSDDAADAAAFRSLCAVASVSIRREGGSMVYPPGHAAELRAALLGVQAAEPRGEFICKRCGIRQDAPSDGAVPF